MLSQAPSKIYQLTIKRNTIDTALSMVSQGNPKRRKIVGLLAYYGDTEGLPEADTLLRGYQIWAALEKC